MRITRILGVAVCALALAACGGEDESNNNGTGGSVGAGGNGGDIGGAGGNGGDPIGPGGSGGNGGDPGGVGGSGGEPTTEPGVFDLSITSTNFEGLGERFFRIDILEATTGEMLANGAWELDAADPTVETGLAGLFEEGTEAIAYWFVDVDESGTCTEADVGEMIEIPAVSAHVELVLDGAATATVDACTPYADLPVDLIVSSLGFSDWADSRVFLTLFDAAGATVNALHQELGTTEFEHTFEGALVPGEAYRLSYFVDLDDDWSCGEGDHVGSVDVTDVTGHTSITLTTEDTAEAGSCDADFPWMDGMDLDILITSSGFDAWAGHAVFVDIASGAEQVATATVLLDGSELNLRGAGLVTQGEDYTLTYFVDLDDDFACSDGDHVARMDFPAISRPIEAELSPTDSTDAAMCTSFGWVADLPRSARIEGTGFDSWEGATAVVQVEYFVDILGIFQMWVPSGTVEAVIESGAFEAVVPFALNEGYEHRINWFVDADDDLVCGAPDPGGQLPLAGTSFPDHMDVVIESNTAGELLCGDFPSYGPGVLFSGSGFEDREGAYVEAYLIDTADPSAYVAYDTAYVKEGGFSIRLSTVELPSTYEVWWYVSSNDIFCDVPADLVGKEVVGSISGLEPIAVTPPAESDEATCNAMNAFWN